MIWNGDYYCVGGFYDGRQEVNAFRVDRINACPEILPDDIVPIPENLDFLGEIEGKLHKEEIKILLRKYGMQVAVSNLLIISQDR